MPIREENYIKYLLNRQNRLVMLEVSLIQQSCGNNIEDNFNKTKALIYQAKEQKPEVKLIILQELHLGEYFCQDYSDKYFDLAMPIDNKYTQELSQIAQELNIVIVSSLFEKALDGLYYNTCIVHETNNSIAGIYRKMHIPNDPGFTEKYYFSEGEQGFVPINTSIGKLGVLICWDQWFPEAARLMALAGAECLIYPTAIGWIPDDPEQDKHKYLSMWKTIQQSHSIANSLPVLSVNRVGIEKSKQNPETQEIEFWGNSFITDTMGQIISQSHTQQDEIIHACINLAETENTRRTWPFLRDRRVEHYSNINKKTI